MQRGIFVIIPGVDICTLVKQRLSRGCMMIGNAAAIARLVQRRTAIIIIGIDIGSFGNKQLGHIHMAKGTYHMKRRRPLV